MSATTTRKLLIAVAMLGALFAMSGPVVAEGESAEIKVADDADPFPLEAHVDPQELFLGMDPVEVSKTQPIRIRGQTLPLGDKGVHYDIIFRYEEGTDLEEKPVKAGELIASSSPAPCAARWRRISSSPMNGGITASR